MLGGCPRLLSLGRRLPWDSGYQTSIPVSFEILGVIEAVSAIRFVTLTLPLTGWGYVGFLATTR